MRIAYLHHKRATARFPDVDKFRLPAAANTGRATDPGKRKVKYWAPRRLREPPACRSLMEASDETP